MMNLVCWVYLFTQYYVHITTNHKNWRSLITDIYIVAYRVRANQICQSYIIKKEHTTVEKLIINQYQISRNELSWP